MIPRLTTYESQRVAPSVLTADEPIWADRLNYEGVGYGDLRVPVDSSADVADARRYLVQLQQETIRRATGATADLAAPMIEFSATSTTVVLHPSYIPTNWKLAMRIASQSWAEVTFATYAAFLAGHTFSSLSADTQYRFRARYWNGGTVTNPTNSSAVFDMMARTAAA